LPRKRSSRGAGINFGLGLPAQQPQYDGADELARGALAGIESSWRHASQPQDRQSSTAALSSSFGSNVHAMTALLILATLTSKRS
jgi:hypothetical protein